MKTTIDFGIDLGTTNSAIARQDGGRTEVIEGPDGLLVPSVIHLSHDSMVTVGAEAVRRRAADPANATSEFKRLMGGSETIAFPAANRSTTPE
jgi:molecular chaperone DnaK